MRWPGENPGLARHLAGIRSGVDPAIGRRLGSVDGTFFTHPDLIDLDAELTWLYPATDSLAE